MATGPGRESGPASVRSSKEATKSGKGRPRRPCGAHGRDRAAHTLGRQDRT